MSIRSKRNEISFRPLKRQDLELVLAWRSNPEIYEHFRKQQGPLTWEEHLNWFNNRHQDRSDYMIKYEGRRVGSVFVDEKGFVGTYIGETSLWGNGIGTEATEWICQQHHPGNELRAEIHKENDASIQLFKRCDFVPEARDENWVIYRFEPDKRTEA
jgi:RimJ/RimL family protein N-acetyltransferase